MKTIHPSERVKTMRHNSLQGIKITFINMPLRETARPNTPPQGPALMAARLRQYGAEPSIIDLNGYRIKDSLAIQKNLSNGRHLTTQEAEQLLMKHFSVNGGQHIVALSGMITTLRWQEQVASITRKLMPECFLISGGGLATEIKAGLFSWIPELDAIAHSEGDDIILVIAQDIRNLLYRRQIVSNQHYYGDINGKKRFVYAGDRPINLDSLPFAAWDLLESDPNGYDLLEDYIQTPVWGMSANNSSAAPFKMKRSLTTVSSRGCPYACAFCYRGAQGERNYGMRSAKNLAREAAWLKERYQIDFLGFPDDNFAVDKKRIGELPEVFKELNLKWGTHTRLDEADERTCGMAKAGCVYIGFGAESASKNVLEKMGKGGFILKNGLERHGDFSFPKTMLNGIKTCRDTGIHANCTWIMGYPGETLHDLKTSVAFILWQEKLLTEGLNQSSTEYAQAKMAVNKKMFTATAYPGTEMFKDEYVRKLLGKNFNISFSQTGSPICDAAFRKYILELDDATKVMFGKDGRPLNFGSMPEDIFLTARRHIDSGNLEQILSL